MLTLNNTCLTLYVTNDHTCTDLSEVLIWIGVEQAALGCRDLSLKDDALTGANQDGSCAGFIAQQLVPAYALNEVASPAGQTAHLLCVSVEVQTLTGVQADQQMGTCSGKIWRRIQLLLLISYILIQSHMKEGRLTKDLNKIHNVM